MLRSDGRVAHFLAQLLHGVLLKLADTLGTNAVYIGQVVQRGFIIGEPTTLQNVPGALIQLFQRQLLAASGVLFKVATL